MANTEFVYYYRGAGEFRGSPREYSLQLDAIPYNPNDTIAGIGSLSISAGAIPQWSKLFNGGVVFNGLTGPVFNGSITQISQSDRDTTSIVATTAMLSTVNRQIFIPAGQYYMPYLDILLNDVFDTDVFHTLPSLTGDQVFTSPAYTGNGWVWLRDLCQAYDIALMLAPADGKVYILDAYAVDPTSTPINRIPVSGYSESVTETSTARKIEVTYNNAEFLAKGQLHPWGDEIPSTISVQAGEVATIEIPTRATWNSVNQPVPVDHVAPNYKAGGTDGCYTISGTDGLAVAASAWTNAGGSVHAAVSKDDPSVIVLTVVAPFKPKLSAPDGTDRFAPYSLALADNTGTGAYATLRLTGEGTATDPKSVQLYTGAAEDTDIMDVGTTYENRFINDLDTAISVGMRMLSSYVGYDQTLSVELPAGASPTLAGPYSQISVGNQRYTINSTSHTPNGTSSNGVPALRIDDFDVNSPSMTFAQFDALYANTTFMDFDLEPLRKA